MLGKKIINFQWSIINENNAVEYKGDGGKFGEDGKGKNDQFSIINWNKAVEDEREGEYEGFGGDEGQ